MGIVDAQQIFVKGTNKQVTQEGFRIEATSQHGQWCGLWNQTGCSSSSSSVPHQP